MNRKSVGYVLLAAIAIASIAATLVATAWWREVQLVAVPLHSSIEALGSLWAVIIALFLLQRHDEAGRAMRLPLVAGFLSMGILDMFHALSTPGHGFVWLHTVAELSGGACFALVWLPGLWVRRETTHAALLSGSIAIGASVLGVWTLVARETLPVMMRGDQFSPTSVTLNVVGGVFFLVAAVRLLVDFHRCESFESYLLACTATMFGLAGLLFQYSALWDPAWWLWHLVRLSAYGFALTFAFVEYYGTVAELRRLLAEHQRTEDDLRNGEIRYRTLFEQSPEGVLLIDPRTARPIEFNDKAAAQLGYSRDEFARLSISDYEAVESPEETERHIETLLREGHDSFETRHRTKEGEIRTVLVTAQKIELSGQPVIHCIFRDVTLLHEQAALARIGEMAAVVAHEVKNPLAGVRGAIQVIGQQLAAGDRHKVVIEEIVNRIDALDELMKDLLLFARPPQLRPAPVDLVALAKETSILMREDPNARNVRVEVTGASVAVPADAKLMNIVLLNLLLNAAHAMKQEGTIRISVDAEDHVCRIAIADTGPGIPPEIRDRIFTPFFTTKTRGTGLGLSTAKRLVEAHQGRLRIECPPGGGTVVTIELPRLITADARAAGRRAPVSAAAGE